MNRPDNIDPREHRPLSPVGVSFVIPVHNAGPWLDAVLESALQQADGRPFEIIAVDDGSTDRSPNILERYASRGLVRVANGPRRGAAAAINEGIGAATHPVICQVDQDVILQAGWMTPLVNALHDRTIAAAQGCYVAAPHARIWARVMNLDLKHRYRRIIARDVDHVCTGNTAYRAAAIRQVGLFDENLGYGYDNDMSYRLTEAGYRLVVDDQAQSIHCWRDSWRSYLAQQYGFGYGRLDLVAKHRHRVTGDDVSSLTMMLHAPLMAVALLSLAIGSLFAALQIPSAVPFAIGAAVISSLALERFAAGIHAAVRFSDVAGVFFAPVHLARDIAWAAALTVWLARRILGVAGRPSNSMRPRAAARAVPDR